MRQKIFADMKAWLRAGYQIPPISLNAAPVEFLRDDYAERLLTVLREHDVPSCLVEVEITEYILIQRGADYVRRALNVLKSAGIRIALDDFGTGHSSLTHLRDYPLDILKIDCSFISEMLDNPSTLALVEAVCMLGPRLSKAVVAEGVETAAQVDALTAMGCEFAQGFLFGPPKNFDAVEVLLSRLSSSQPLLRDCRYSRCS